MLGWLKNSSDKMKPEDMTSEPPICTTLAVGDQVTYTNDQGVVFEPRTVVGFTFENCKWGRVVYIDTDCYWSPVHPESLKPYEEQINVT